jgi:hypothetical protein
VASELYLPLVASRTGPDASDHVHSAAAVGGGATVVLSADRRGYPKSDIAPARRSGLGFQVPAPRRRRAPADALKLQAKKE